MKGKKVYELINDDTVDFDNGYVIYSEDGVKNLKAPVQMFADAVLESYRDGSDEDWIEDDTEHEPAETDEWIAGEVEGSGEPVFYNKAVNPKADQHLGKTEVKSFYNPYLNVNSTYKEFYNVVFHDGWNYDGADLKENKPFEGEPGSFYDSPGTIENVLMNNLYVHWYDSISGFSLNESNEIKKIMKEILDIRTGPSMIISNQKVQMTTMEHLFTDIDEDDLLFGLPIGYVGHYVLMANRAYELYQLHSFADYSRGPDQPPIDRPGEFWISENPDFANQDINCYGINHESFVIYPTFYLEIPGFKSYFTSSTHDESIETAWFSTQRYNTFTYHPEGNRFYEAYMDAVYDSETLHHENHFFFKNGGQIYYNLEYIDELFNSGPYPNPKTDLLFIREDNGEIYYTCVLYQGFLERCDLLISHGDRGVIGWEIDPVTHQPVVPHQPIYADLYSDATLDPLVENILGTDAPVIYGGKEDVEKVYKPEYSSFDYYLTQAWVARRYNMYKSALSNNFADFGGFGMISPNHYLDLMVLSLNRDYMVAHKLSRLEKQVNEYDISDDNFFISKDDALVPYCRYIYDNVLNHGMDAEGRSYISSFTINGHDIVEQTVMSHQSQANIVVKAANGLAVVREHNVLRLGLTTEMYNSLQHKLNFGDGIDYDEETGVVSADGSIDDILVNGRSVVSNKVASIDLTNINLIQECQLQTSLDGYTRVTEQQTTEYDDLQIQHTYRDYTIDISSDIVPTEQTYYPNQVNVRPYEYGPDTAGYTQTLYSYESYILIFDVVIVSPVDAEFCLFLKDNSHPTGYPFDPSNQYYDSDYVDFDIQDVKANIPTKFRIVKVVPATTGRSSYTSNSYQAAIMNTLPYSEWPLPSNIYAYCNTTVKKLINT